ncbi:MULTISPECIES: hypothetical protein [Acinetobacter calcoaceticus/baumannii complex]|uniref:hypothetical protein n=1 Tax=Acinetobacter calcoaceticus/baumannii complex TaxID=909768 RepID=UPI001C0E1145|nr:MULTISPECIES: hypothetical protein [Acinetobacter calcoaceticus/baumannii complex]MBU3166883.1 hypothetical protein [Acinetobacter baumannii]MCU4548427.1 hypothetical protein [Acinetobacter pittii]
MTTKSFQNLSVMQRVEVALFVSGIAVAYMLILMLIMKPYLIFINPIAMLFVDAASLDPFNDVLQLLSGFCFILTQLSVLLIPYIFVRFLVEIFLKSRIKN